MKKFWLVWRVNGSGPTVAHESYDAARREAERLARSLRGERFAVLESRSSVVVNDVQWSEAVGEQINDDEIPW